MPKRFLRLRRRSAQSLAKATVRDIIKTSVFKALKLVRGLTAVFEPESKFWNSSGHSANEPLGGSMDNRSRRHRRQPEISRRNHSVPASLALLLIVLVLATGMILAGCGGDDEPADSEETATTEAASGDSDATAQDLSGMSGAELGDAASALYAQAMQDLNALLADKPDAAAVTADVEALREEYIQQMVALGAQRETLDDLGKTEMDAAMASAMMSANNEDWYTTYSDLYEHYAAGDVDFVNLLASFNILTQYANYDLLKEQDPEEAARLGIE